MSTFHKIGVTLAPIMVLLVVYSVKGRQAPDPVRAVISEEGGRKIETLTNEDLFINTTLDRYLQQLETISG